MDTFIRSDDGASLQELRGRFDKFEDRVWGIRGEPRNPLQYDYRSRATLEFITGECRRRKEKEKKRKGNTRLVSGLENYGSLLEIGKLLCWPQVYSCMERLSKQRQVFKFVETH